MTKIKQFIVDNDLDFESTDSGLNANCVVLAGYALHLGMDDFEEELLPEVSDFSDEALEELERVFDYARVNNYGAWWSRSVAKKMYTF
jgi:hypothetical protein